MKKLLVILFVVSIVPVQLFAVKLKNVTQTGSGNTGSVKIEFNGDYNKSNITTNYLQDRVELVIPNAFVVPVKRLFKSSSSKSSVAKIEAVNISGRSLRVSIFFNNIAMDVIKKTAKLTSKNNVVSFDYATISEGVTTETGTVSDDTKTVKEPEKETSKPTVENNKIQAIEPVTIKIDDTPSFSRSLKKYALALAKFFKIALLIILLGAVIFALFFVIRKYARDNFVERPQEKVFGSTKAQNTTTTPDIKIVNSLDLEKDKKLYVVDVLGERLLIASGKNYVTMLSRLQNDNNDGQGYLFTQTHSDQIMKTRLKDTLNNI